MLASSICITSILSSLIYLFFNCIIIMCIIILFLFSAFSSILLSSIILSFIYYLQFSLHEPTMEYGLQTDNQIAFGRFSTEAPSQRFIRTLSPEKAILILHVSLLTFRWSFVKHCCRPKLVSQCTKSSPSKMSACRRFEGRNLGTPVPPKLPASDRK